MKNLIFLLFILLTYTTISAQEIRKKNNFSVAYYSTKEISFHFNQRRKISFEARYRPGGDRHYVNGYTTKINGSYGNYHGNNYYGGGNGQYSYLKGGMWQSDYNDIENGYISLIARYNKDILKDKVSISSGLGIGLALSSFNNDYIVIPIDLKAYNLFNTNWIGCSAGVDLRVSSGCTQLVPKVGLMINF
ncbi:hypothetical protein EMN47_07070 [Prolixibacteraceae bacterium JC049]|nr:hypothetical protein [Prolixibacteraceae bacterium JC049]